MKNDASAQRDPVNATPYMCRIIDIHLAHEAERLSVHVLGRELQLIPLPEGLLLLLRVHIVHQSSGNSILLVVHRLGHLQRMTLLLTELSCMKFAYKNFIACDA